MYVLVWLKRRPAIDFHVIGQRKLIPSALNCFVSPGINRKHLGAQPPFALPSLWQVYSSPSRITTEELDIASLVEAFSHEMPCEAELCLLRHLVAFFRRPVIPGANVFCEGEHVQNNATQASTGTHKQNTRGTRMILERHFGPVARVDVTEKPQLSWQRLLQAIARREPSPERDTRARA